MNLVKWIALSLTVAALTSCVSPFYGTARIEKEFHIDGGVAVMSEITPSMDSWAPEYSFGIRADTEIKYSFNSFFQLHSRVTLGGAVAWPPILINAALGAQTAFPIGSVTPAIRAEVSGYGGGLTFSPTFMLGVGKKEWLTLGARTHILGNAGDTPHPEYGPYLDPFPIDCFVGLHLGRWNVFAGSQMFRYSYNAPVATIGIGYKIK